jgi:hypothetical protein
MKTYDVIDTSIMTADFKDDAGAYVNPSAVSFSLTKPDGTVIIYVYGTDVELEYTDIGTVEIPHPQYSVKYVVDLPGFYRYHFESGTGEEAAADEWFYGIDKDIELTTLSHVKSWAEVTGITDDYAIQLCISAFSRYVLNRTGRDTLGPIKDFTEIKNGSGSSILANLRNWPITELTNVQVNGVVIPISSGYGIGGVAVTGNLKQAIAILPGFSNTSALFDNLGSFSAPIFSRGINNVLVEYSAGYGYVPEDLEQAACEAISANYKRKAWQDLASKSISSQGATGTTSYRDWHLSPGVERVIGFYSRKTY